MSKRQKRITFQGNTSVLLEYIEQEVNVVCNSGEVFHGILHTIEKDYIEIKDFSGNKIKLSLLQLKELIIDYVSR